MQRLLPLLIAIALTVAASPALADEPEADETDVEAVEEDASADEADDDATEEVADADDEEADEAADDEDTDEIAELGEPEDEVDEPEADDEHLDIEESEPTDTGATHPMLAVAPHIGVIAPQPFGDLGSWPVFGLDAGYILPFDVGAMERPLQLGIHASYTRPGATGEGTHPMLGEEGADYNWELDQQILTLQLTTMWRFMSPGQGLSAHALVGPRVYLMESVMEASGNDADFGENTETNTEYGVVFGGGVEFMLGPGALTGTVTVGGSPLDQRITGEANTGAINLDLGYRLFF